MDVAQHTPQGRLDTSPYDVPDDVQSNIEDYQTPYDDIATILRAQNVFLERIADASESQREQPRPTQVDLNTTTPFSTTIALRAEFIVLTCSAACQIGIRVGSSVQRVFNFAAADTKVIPYITHIGRGVDLLLTTTAGTVTGYLIAYPE